MKVKVLDDEALVRLSESNIRAGRSQNLGLRPLPHNEGRSYVETSIRVFVYNVDNSCNKC